EYWAFLTLVSDGISGVIVDCSDNVTENNRCVVFVVLSELVYFFLHLYFKKTNESMPVPSIVRQLLLFFCYIFSLFIFQKIK
ncbi:hypothetical protein BY996DRAFT_7779485, partial [Phakopsora pachyrhizi]